MRPTLAVTHQVSRAIKQHDWRAACVLLEEHGVERRAAQAFVGWERQSTARWGLEPARPR